MEWCALIDGKFSCSDGGLFKCPHCGGLTWIGWYPECFCCHKKVNEKDNNNE